MAARCPDRGEPLDLAPLLLTALFVRRPLSFGAFPTILLVTTLFRLGLNVSSTRLILLQADAGTVIAAFGEFVVRGNYDAIEESFFEAQEDALTSSTKEPEQVSQSARDFFGDVNVREAAPAPPPAQPEGEPAEKLATGQTVDVEAQLIRVRSASPHGAEGSYVRL